MERLEWNAVVVGYWNLAILTPTGIAQRLLRLEPETPVSVEVPMDWLSPNRVRHGGLVVVAQQDRLLVAPEEPTYEGLRRACEVAATAIEALPETPLSGAGFNIRYKADNPPVDLLNATSCAFDDAIVLQEFNIVGRQLRRELDIWDGGVLRLDMSLNDEFQLSLNYHRSASVASELVGWLRRPSEAVREVTDRVLRAVGLEDAMGDEG